MAKKAPPAKKTVKKPAKKSSSFRSKPYPIVAIGASAGGIEAITELLKNLSPSTGMSFIYLQHLDPTHASSLTEMLSRVTKMKVVEAKSQMKVEPNQVVILPPNKGMTLVDGVFQLNQRPPRPAIHMPINQFFQSLAEKQKDGAIGIVLSGNSNDGSSGLRAIKSAGGITFAQDESAKFWSMPKSAIAEGVVDSVLSPAAIAKELERLSKNIHLLQIEPEEKEEVAPDKDSVNDLENILQLIKKFTGVDFSLYKRNTINRRLVRRMLLNQHDNLREYLHYLRRHTDEVEVLFNDLLINVTSFFRDKEANEFLKKNLLPRIIKSKKLNEPIRVWVPACSTGEEAYSLAIMLVEALGESASNSSVQIFATDLSDQAIVKARLGIYSKSDVGEVSPKRLQRFFTKIDGGYRISKNIRDLCVFAPHNIFKDPPFSRIDLISCCNLLIYLDLTLQKKILATFHYSLNENGFLILGKSETVGTLQNLFTSIDKKYKIYARKKDSSSKQLFEPDFKLMDIGIPSLIEKQITHKQNKPKNQISELEHEVNNVLLEKFITPCVVINSNLEIILFKGSTGLFLEPPTGRASFNILKMARPELGLELRSLIHKSMKSGKRELRQNIEFRHSGETAYVTLEAFLLPEDDNDKKLLILFHPGQKPMPPPQAGRQSDKRIKELETELESTREDMRSIIEEQEAVNEELQSANEEIVSSNEELQSINEELETSKEEVESMNEELMTMNQEMQNRNEQLTEAYDYAEAVFTTIREGLIVLDNELRVKTANRTFYNMFQTSERETEGRLIYDLGDHKWNLPRLHELLEQQVPQRNLVTGYRIELQTEEAGKKILLFNARSVFQRILNQQVILLAIEDITEHATAEQIINERADWFKNMADNAPVMIWVVDADKVTIFFNKTWLEFSGRTLKQEIAAGWLEGVHPDDMIKVIEEFNRNFDSRTSFQMEYRRRHHDGNYRWLLSISQPTYDINGDFSGFVGTCTDIHENKMAEKYLKESTERVHTVLHKLPLMAWMSDSKGKLVFVNTWYSRFTGQSLDDAIKSGFSKVIHADDYSQFQEAWNKQLKTGNSIEAKVRFFESSSGKYKWHILRANSIRDDKNKVTGWVGTNTDFHDQQIFAAELEQSVKSRTIALQDANLNLERSNNELQQFAYVASHDLQEPLRKIITFSDRLKRSVSGELDAKSKLYLQRIEQSAQRMSHLIEDLLNFSKVGTRQLFESVDLNKVLEDVLKDLEVSRMEKQAKIISDKLPTLEAVPIQMEQLFSNLLSNSLKFSSNERNALIEVRQKKLTKKDVERFPNLNPKNSYTEIIFSDNGVGFDNEVAEQIFILFQRLEGRNIEGTGIGLALCRKIVNFHNGHIWAESKEDHGATFHVILPLKRKG